MRRMQPVIIFTVLILLSVISNSALSQDGETLRNNIGLEFGGKAGTWNLSYQHMVFPWVGLGLGVSVATGPSSAAFMIPFGGIVYLFSYETPLWSVTTSPFIGGGYVWMAGKTNGTPPIGLWFNSIPKSFDGVGWPYAELGIEQHFGDRVRTRAAWELAFVEGESISWPGFYIGFIF